MIRALTMHAPYATIYTGNHQIYRQDTSMEEKRVNRVSFSLEEEYRDLLQRIATIERRSMTDVMRLLIDRRAEELGLEPVAPTIPSKMKGSE